MRKWRIEDSLETYNVHGWGKDYFDINKDGHLCVSPEDRDTLLDIKSIIDELKGKGLHTPVLLRFPEILDDRIEQISKCFQKSSKEYEFKGQFFNVYPIKVNQQRPVLEEIVKYGKKFNIGLEAGSKPELQAVLSLMDNPEALIICNGYKDRAFIEMALLAQKMGKKVFIVIEKLSELKLIHQLATDLNVKPSLGIRIKLASSGSGRWESSGGDQSKFGLNPSDLIKALQFFKDKDVLDWIDLVHFHLGSQITNIRKIKSGFREVAQFYSQLAALGCTIEFIDIGGGLGVDYDGTNSSVTHSINYSIQEYANDAISSIHEICEKENLPHPNVISESGRALTAHHSVLVFDVMETSSSPEWDDSIEEEEGEELHEITVSLMEILEKINKKNLMENWHDTLQYREDTLDLFSHGLINLKTRARTEQLVWSIARKVYSIAKTLKRMPDELSTLPKLLSDKYFCNFSLFQSLPDSWAIDQIFPIMPIQRLNEKPTKLATLQDITCDSDGKIDTFVTSEDYDFALPVHPISDGEPYYLAVMLVGAYQEILGDLHNLFGDTNIVHISQKGDGYSIDKIIEGETVSDVLEYVQFKDKQLTRNIEKWVAESIAAKRISQKQGEEFIEYYEKSLHSYTYLIN